MKITVSFDMDIPDNIAPDLAYAKQVAYDEVIGKLICNSLSNLLEATAREPDSPLKDRLIANYRMLADVFQESSKSFNVVAHSSIP